MVDFTRVPVVRIIWPFVSGVYAGYHWGGNTEKWYILAAAAALFACMIPGYRGGRCHSGRGAALFCMAAWSSIFLCGWGAGSQETPSDPGLPVHRPVVISATILSVSESRGGGISMMLQMRFVRTGDTLLPVASKARYHPRGRGRNALPGEEWLLGGTLVPMRSNGNPGEVDYPAIWARQDCWYTFFDKDTSLCSCRGIAGSAGPDRNRIRAGIAAAWKGHPDDTALLQAVCLGNRSLLSPGLRDAYAAAGGMHLLAVSGLHVGIIWWVLNQALSWLTRRGRNELYRFIPLVILLWGYAWLTGFSSSVLRAVTMCCLFSLARLLGRRAISLNTVFLSMLLLILIDPVRMFQAGFQLSYAAVLGIMLFYPWIRARASPSHPLLKWIWQGVGVSLAAQAGTLPLVIHYFHQFPLYGVATNLLTIPLLTCIMVLFVAGFPFLAAGTFHQAAAWPMLVLARSMNWIVSRVGALPGSLLTGIHAEPPLHLLVMLGLCFLAFFIHSRKPVALALVMLATALGFCFNLKHCLEISTARELWVMHFRGASMVSVRDGPEMDHYVWVNRPDQVPPVDRYLESAWGHRAFDHSVVVVRPGLHPETYPGGISQCRRVCRGMYCLGNNEVRCLVLAGDIQPGMVTGSGDYLSGSGVVVFRDEPVLERADLAFLSDRAGQLVADGSNGAWYLQRIAERIPAHFPGIHVTSEMGAFRLAY